MQQTDATIEGRGAIGHAPGIAVRQAARRGLLDALLNLARLPNPERRRSAGRALQSWKGLVDARWTLVDHFEIDGKRYLVAQCEFSTQDISCLTARERQVLAFATLGHTNKLIAHELGISPCTVAVFMHRATRKLGAHTRKELIEMFEILLSRDVSGAR